MFGVEKEILLSGFIGSIIGVLTSFSIYFLDLIIKSKKEKKFTKKKIRRIYNYLTDVFKDNKDQVKFMEAKNEWKANRHFYAFALGYEIFNLLDSICITFYFPFNPSKEISFKEAIEADNKIIIKLEKVLTLLEKKYFKKEKERNEQRRI